MNVNCHTPTAEAKSWAVETSARYCNDENASLIDLNELKSFLLLESQIAKNLLEQFVSPVSLFIALQRRSFGCLITSSSTLRR